MKAYLSHCIRGIKGETATMDDMRHNCEAAIGYGNMLRKNMPELDLYIPAEHEDFVQRVYEAGWITVEQILDVDCSIISTKDIVIVYNPEGISPGMRVEIDYAKLHNMKVMYAHRPEKNSHSYDTVYVQSNYSRLVLYQEQTGFKPGDIVTSAYSRAGAYLVRVDKSYEPDYWVFDGTVITDCRVPWGDSTKKKKLLKANQTKSDWTLWLGAHE